MSASCVGSRRRLPSIAAVLPLQLIHQVAEMGRQLGIFGSKVLPQPFADATAYRSAGSAIDLFAALVDSVHRGSASRSLLLTDMVPSHPHRNCFARSSIACLLRKN
jgi:hypothetical protein